MNKLLVMLSLAVFSCGESAPLPEQDAAIVVTADASVDAEISPTATCTVFNQPSPSDSLWQCTGIDYNFICEDPEFRIFNGGTEIEQCFAYCVNGGEGGSIAGVVTGSEHKRFTTFMGTDIICQVQE